MNSPFRAYTRCPADLLAPSRTDDHSAEIDDLRLERYRDNSITDVHATLSPESLIRSAYYTLRPLLSVGMRKHLQRFALRGWEKIPFPAWPVDTGVEKLVADHWMQLLEVHDTDTLPFVWFWPDGHRSCAVMTHDVETAAGRDFCGHLMDMEAAVGVVSSFEVVPEERYEVTPAYLDSIRRAGCEVCIHGLSHDGHLFSSRTGFLERAARINAYAANWRAVGFRSPVMYRNLDLIGHLDFEYDMSVPNVGHLDPQRGGCCTVMPYFIGDTLELPLTTIQDYPLYNNLGRYDMDLWREQTDIVVGRHGLLSFIIHPDYTIERRAQDLFRELLDHLCALRDDRGTWLALPGEVNDWWRLRSRMELQERNGRWCVTGPSCDRAKVGLACREAGGLVYRVQD
ncbi:hypothetical protein KKG45_06695 [bacterium]|nr:hypothetical protein [bacterium]MBU1072916.1 hypothetical protein [bacterium]MBU1674788.1 hypothetical protein [bacterium]